MTPVHNTYNPLVFSIIGAFVIVGAAWVTKGVADNDTWLYVFSVWMILFSAFESYSTIKERKISKIVLAVLGAASLVIFGAWWANGAENARVFLTSVVTLLVAFAILLPKSNQG